MKAVTYHGTKDVRVENVADPVIHAADDIVLRVTATAICGSDLHIYRGKIPAMEAGDIIGHEFMGIVEETGADVTALEPGDRVIVPFVIACGRCHFCAMNLFAACETSNTGTKAVVNPKHVRPGAALFGYSHLYGGVPGGQAEYVRVPKANFGPFKVPDTLSDERALFLTDILPTGYQAVLNAKVGPGSSLAIFGAGPVGLMAAACARMLGVETLYMIDHHDYRLQFAADNYGAIPINFDLGQDAAESLIAQSSHRGLDAVIDAVGFEAQGNAADTVLSNLKIEGSSGKALRHCITAVRRGGVVSVAGVYTGTIHAFLFGDIFDKGVTVKTGQTHVQRYLPELLTLIEQGKLYPDVIISHRLPLSQATEAYHMFDQHHDNCRKIVLTP